MKTSQQQFDLMITFMEQHGDLNKPTTNARGKITAMKNWDNLTSLLNSVGSGDTKSIERWKKVWSDFKNNTKKKAARLNKAAKGTGGGPAIYSKLNDLEHRVLNIIGTQAATGLPVDKAGFSQEVQIDERGPSTQIQAPHPPPRTEPTISPPRLHVDAEIERIIDTSMDQAIPSPPNVTVSAPRPTLSDQTTPRRSGRRTRARVSLRRRVRPVHTDQAAQHFLSSDSEWRNFRMQQHRDYMDMRREQLRVRELELQTQMEWQAVACRFVNCIDKIVDKYCKEDK